MLNLFREVLSKTKEKMKIEERNDVVYKIPCKDCNLCYIMETSKQVISRVEEHKKNVNQKHMSSLIYQHIARKNHNMDWNNVSVLNQHHNTYSRKIQEACHTLATPHSFNRAIIHYQLITYTNITHNTLIN